MISIFKKSKPIGEKLEFQIDGMHCTSCSLNIDGSLEDMDGVIDSKTSYAKGKTIVSFDPQKTNQKDIEKTIQDAGYKIKNSN